MSASGPSGPLVSVSKRNMICLGDVKLEKTHDNWKSEDTDFKILYSLFTLH